MIKFIILIIFFSFQLSAANTRDSLLKVINSHADDSIKVNTLNKLSKLYRQPDPDSSVKISKTALNLSKKIGYKYGEAKAYNHLGIVYGWFLGKTDSSVAFFNKAIKGFTELKNNHDLIIAYNNLGIIFGLKERYSDAIASLKRCLHYTYLVNDSSLIAQTNMHIGEMYREIDDYTTALSYLYEGLELYENIDNKAGIARCYNNIGIIFSDRLDSDRALDYYEKALKIKEKLGNEADISTSVNNIGSVYFSKGDYTKALSYFQKSLNSDKKLNNKRGQAQSLNSIGDCYLKMGDIQTSEKYLLRSLKMSKEINDRSIMVSGYVSLADLYAEKKIFKEALNYGLTGYKLAKEIGVLSTIRDAAWSIYNIYNRSGDYKKALDYFTIYEAHKDSLDRKEQMNTIEKLSLRYETEKNIRENKRLKENQELNAKIITRQKETNITMAVTLLTVMALTVVIYFLYQIKRKANKELEEKTDLIKKQKEELEKINLNLETANRTKDKFFSIISHDLINPFSSYRNTAAMLSDNYDNLGNADRKEFVKSLKVSSDNLLQLLNNILTWSKTQRELIKSNPEKININDVVSHNFNLLRDVAGKKKIQLEFDNDKEIFAYTDLNLTNTILRNLISNAIKFTPFEGKITVDCSSNNGLVEVAVIDTGVGIEESKLKHIFDMDKSKTSPGTDNEPGTGFGLILCKEFTDLIGGSIRAESHPGEGSKFTVTMPAYQG